MISLQAGRERLVRAGERTRFAALSALAGLALAIEQGTARFLPFLAVVVVLLALLLLDVLPDLSPVLHGMVLAGFAVALALAGRYAAGASLRLSWDARRARLERASGLAHRPLTAAQDALAAGRDDPLSRALWQRHQDGAATAWAVLKVPRPAPVMARVDPFGLRAIVLLLLVMGILAGWNDAGSRLVRGLVPAFHSGPADAVTAEIWITPPAYTGRPPVFLRNADFPPAGAAPTGEGGPEAAAEPVPLVVPAESKVLAQVTGTKRPPEVVLGDESPPTKVAGSSANERNGRRYALAEVSAGEKGAVYRGEVPLRSGTHLSVRAGRRELMRVPLRVVEDAPPRVRFAEGPRPAAPPFTEFVYRASDDYGVVAVDALLHLDVADRPLETDGEDGPEEALRLSLPLGAGDGRDLSGRGSHDLSPHPWAGLPVVAHLEASDAAGQVARSEAVRLLLPERTFDHPVAKAVIALRKTLWAGGDRVRGEVAAGLQGLAARPEHFAHDVVVSLTLSVARARLLADTAPSALGAVRDLMWQTALRLEEGDVPAAEKDLRDAQQRLADALKSNAPAAEIERLIDELERALDDFLAALAAQAARDGMEGLPPPPGAFVRDEDLKDILDMARQLARTGARDSARQLLAELKRLLEGLRAGDGRAQSAEAIREANRLLKGIEDLTARQQALLDDTFRQLQDSRTQERLGRPQTPAANDSAAAQEQLRRDLGALMLELDSFLGAIPGPLGEAERAMDEAAKALGRGALGEATGSQGQALELLRQGTGQASAAIAQMLGNRGGLFGMDPDERQGEGDDPFGREAGGMRGFHVDDVKIPDKSQVQRAEEILDELRRRAGDRQRPADERQYIERLLRPF